MTGKQFATILIVLDLCAALSYGWDGDWKRSIYWSAAAILTWSVTY